MNNPKCFFEVSADGENIGRMVFELREDLVPKTVENFKKLCEGFDGKCFKTSIFHRIIPGFMCQVRPAGVQSAPGEGQSVCGRVCVSSVYSVCVCVYVYCPFTTSTPDRLHIAHCNHSHDCTVSGTAGVGVCSVLGLV